MLQDSKHESINKLAQSNLYNRIHRGEATKGAVNEWEAPLAMNALVIIGLMRIEILV